MDDLIAHGVAHLGWWPTLLRCDRALVSPMNTLIAHVAHRCHLDFTWSSVLIASGAKPICGSQLTSETALLVLSGGTGRVTLQDSFVDLAPGALFLGPGPWTFHPAPGGARSLLAFRHRDLTSGYLLGSSNPKSVGAPQAPPARADADAGGRR